MVLVLGCGRWGLFDALVAEERKALCYPRSYALDTKGQGFPKPVKFPKVPGNCL